jgi:hypothetical protein
MPSSVTIDLLSFAIGMVFGIVLFIAVVLPIMTRSQQ